MEMLLVSAILLLLLGATAFEFSTLGRGAELNEGAARLESVLNFARAEASNSGRKVRLVFEQQNQPDAPSPLQKIRITWESNPFTEPGVYTDLTTAAWIKPDVNDFVGVEDVTMITGSNPDPAASPAPSEGSATDRAAKGGQGTARNARPGSAGGKSPVSGSGSARTSSKNGRPGAGSMEDDEAAEQASADKQMPPVTFYPDGSSDSAEIRIASRDPRDTRRVAVRVMGMSGTVTRRIMAETQDGKGTDEAGGDRNDSPDKSPVGPARKFGPSTEPTE